MLLSIYPYQPKHYIGAIHVALQVHRLGYDEEGFSNSHERIAATHQYGLREKLGKRGPVVKYPQRRLLGARYSDRDIIEKLIINYLLD
ncbi:phage virion morphogenesis protein [Hafnia sp.]|uniref:phage virion morphogenesis protein n=1 Tax=Hafnia sp. TaxID=1873498 RepID=UPI002FC7DF34